MYQGIDISLRIQGKTILHHADITIHPGKFTAVAGPNGAGKSSLLKVMAQEYNQYGGRVLINKKLSKSYSSKELARVRAVLPQQSAVQFGFCVEQIVMLGRHLHVATKKKNAAVVEQVMALTDTLHLRERTYATLSGGERQRVQLARVLSQVWEETTFPRYILLDEPTSSLDIAQQQNIFSLAKKVCERNIGVMAIIHDLNQSVQYADYLYFLREGKIIASGDTHRVFTKSTIEEAFGCRVNVYYDPCNNCPYIIPERERIKLMDTRDEMQIKNDQKINFEIMNL